MLVSYHVGSSYYTKLVKSPDNLLVVEMLWNPGKSVGFRVFRLSEEEQRWDEMESLGGSNLVSGF